MARHIADQHRTPAFGGRGNMTTLISVVDIGAAGAPTVNSNQSDPEIGWTRTGAGVYDVTFPPCPRGIFDPKIVRTAAPTVFTVHVTARNMPAGTATVRFNNAAGAATDPANGDIVGAVLHGATALVG